jgi:hypothetical protein
MSTPVVDNKTVAVRQIRNPWLALLRIGTDLIIPC